MLINVAIKSEKNSITDSKINDKNN